MSAPTSPCAMPRPVLTNPPNPKSKPSTLAGLSLLTCTVCVCPGEEYSRLTARDSTCIPTNLTVALVPGIGTGLDIRPSSVIDTVGRRAW